MKASLFLLILALLVSLPSMVVYAIVEQFEPRLAMSVGVLAFMFIFSQIIDRLTTKR